MLWVTRRGRGYCHAHYYLGRIDRMQNVGSFGEHFLRACSCIEGTARNIDRQIQSAATLDLEPAEKDRFRERLRAKLADHRRSSAELIRGMVRLYETGRDRPDPAYSRLMNDFVARLEAAPAK